MLHHRIPSVCIGQALGTRWARLLRGAGSREVVKVINTYTDPEVAVVESVGESTTKFC